MNDLPKTLRDFLQTEAGGRIQEVDRLPGGSTDFRVCYDVLLKPGWAYDQMHMFLEPTAADVVRNVKAAVRCECRDCKTELGIWTLAKKDEARTAEYGYYFFDIADAHIFRISNDLYVLAASERETGDVFMTSDGRRVSLYNVHGNGEPRWEVDAWRTEHRDDDAAAIDYFGLTIEDAFTYIVELDGEVVRSDFFNTICWQYFNMGETVYLEDCEEVGADIVEATFIGIDDRAGIVILLNGRTATQVREAEAADEDGPSCGHIDLGAGYVFFWQRGAGDGEIHGFVKQGADPIIKGTIGWYRTTTPAIACLHAFYALPDRVRAEIKYEPVPQDDRESNRPVIGRGRYGIIEQIDARFYLKDGARIIGSATPHGGGYHVHVHGAAGWADTKVQAVGMLARWGADS